MQHYTKRMTTTPLLELVITIFPAERGEFTLYEDDGISREFEDGTFLKTKLTYQNINGSITLDIVPEGNGYRGMPSERSYQIRLMQTNKPLSIIEGNGMATFENNVNTIVISKQDIRQSVKIVLQ
jgi:hypothetical protein